MSDKELLELAAKAAGYQLEKTIVGGEEKLYLAGDLLEWNPLTNDGDALRLAVAFCMNIDVGAQFCEASVIRNDERISAEEECNGDHCAATRRAIVRAAVELGKTL